MQTYKELILIYISKYLSYWQIKREKNDLFNLKISAETSLRVVNFLDVTFDLSNGKYKP
jgi:hypothetical protein